MRKRELEQARHSFNTGINTEQLRARVGAELAPIKDAYDVAHQALQQIEQLIQGIHGEEKPVRAMRELAASLRDVTGVLIAARDEARSSVRFAVEGAKGAAAPTATDTEPTDAAAAATPALTARR